MTNTPTTTSKPTTGSPGSTDGGTADQAGAEARHVADAGREKATQLAGEAQSQAADLARTARDQAKERGDGEVDRLAGFVGKLGDELDDMATRSDDHDGYLPGLVRDGAQAANRLSHRLEAGGLDGAIGDIERFARRRPGLFLAAAFGVGLALGRVTRNADFHAISDEMHGDAPSDALGQTQRPAGDAMNSAATVSDRTTAGNDAEAGSPVPPQGQGVR